MLQIKEFKFSTYNAYLTLWQIDSEIRSDLNALFNSKIFSELKLQADFVDMWSKMTALPSFTMLSLNEIEDSVNDLQALSKYYDTSLGTKKKFKTQVTKYKNAKQLKGRLKLKNLLEDIFDYKGRRSVLLNFYKEQNLTACLYCFAQNTIIYTSKDDKKLLTGNLDHLKPKIDYPYLSVTINNLVPTCAHCNQRKWSNDLKYSPITKYALNYTDPTFNFAHCLEKIDLNNLQFNFSKLEIIDSHLGLLNEKLDLSGLYKQYDFHLINILARYQKFNSPSYKKYITNLLGSDHSAVLEYFISEVPYTEDKLIRVPLHKFKSDFYNYLRSLATTH